MRNKIFMGFILVFAILQLFTPEKIAYKEPSSKDLFAVEEAPQELKLLIHKACYDCHSNQVAYPWYATIAPVSFWIQDHIEHGSEHLNFSDWGDYSSKKKAHKAEEAYEELGEEEMPLKSYTFIHREAHLSDQQREELMSWFASIEEKYQ